MKNIMSDESQIKKEILDKYKYETEKHTDGSVMTTLFDYPYEELGCPCCGSMDYKINDPFQNGEVIDLECHSCKLRTEIIPDEEFFLESLRQNSYSIPRCPTCDSAFIKPISTTQRMAGLFLAGLASSNLGKTMECKNCGYKW